MARVVSQESKPVPILHALATVLGGSVAATGTTSAAEDDITHDPANAMRFRSSFGLSADAAYVDQSLTDPETFSDMTFGVPLTEFEADDIRGRTALAVSVQAALDYALAQPDYAGMYFDQKLHGLPVFLFTSALSEHADAIRTRVPEGVAFELRQASLTLSQLEQLMERIARERDDFVPSLPITATDVDVRNNVVRVRLRENVAAATDVLRERYGDHFAVSVSGVISQDSCTSRNNCGGTSTDPWKGGIKIFLSGSQSFYCTSGILARRGSNLVMVTAGHCLVNSPADFGDNWRHNTNSPHTIGNALSGSIADANGSPGDGCSPNGCDGDVGWIDVDNFASVTPLDTFVANGVTDIRSVDSVPGDASVVQQPGGTMCRGGATSNYVCGQIAYTDAHRFDLDGHEVEHLHMTDFEASPGDSGGTMFFGSWFLGIHNDSLDNADPPDPGYSWYSSGAKIQAWGNSICTTSTC